MAIDSTSGGRDWGTGASTVWVLYHAGCPRGSRRCEMPKKTGSRGGTEGALRIEDYALIGDCQTAALVGVNGSIDWLCLPRFESGACFAALLGTRDNGRWLIAPRTDVAAVRRQYRDHTLILETEFETSDGVACVIDFMPSRDQDPNLVRIVEGRKGKVRMRSELII